ncbi:MAG: hypothetical protein AAFV88_07765 [Planctomycetota bacterium]
MPNCLGLFPRMDLKMQSKRNQWCRRGFLTGGLVCGVSALTSAGAIAQGTKTSAIIEPSRQPLLRTRIEIEVTGNVDAGEAAAGGKSSRKLPIESKASFDYEERALWPEGASEDSEIVAAQRYYHRAICTSKLNKTASTRTLRDPMRLTMIRRDDLPETIYSSENFFTHAELSLLRSPISSVAADQFLPRGRVLEGDSFEIEPNAICSVLNLTTVDTGTVTGKVISIDNESVKFQLKGDLEASIDGVSTRLRLIGKMTYDRASRTCSWLALALHETREKNAAEPGFDVSATIRMLRKPLAKPVRLPSEAPKVDFARPVPDDYLYVELRSNALRLGTMVDRRWKVIQDQIGSAVIRITEHGSSIAQCNLRPLPALPEGKQLTLEGFERDVRTSLGNQLQQLVSGDQAASAQGLRVLRMVADGESKGVRLRWIIMHFSDNEGRRVQATFTMAAEQVDAFAGGDIQFADSLRFLSPEETKPTSEEVAESRDLDGDRPAAAIAELPEDLRSSSASDLR